MTERSVVSIGVAASIGPQLAAELAPLVEEAGFHALWVNDTPGADALAVLGAAAGTTSELTLATGVLPVDRRPATLIAEQVRARRLPEDRLVLGIGSGSASVGALSMMSEASAELRSNLSARVVFGALGPKMRQRAVRESDGVLLSWLTPEIAAAQAIEAHDIAPDTHVALYVRTALHESAAGRLREETQRYGSFPSYAANFARLQMRPEDTVLMDDAMLDAGTHDVRERLDSYRDGVQEVVLRAMTAADSLDEYRRFIDSARALL